MASIVRPECREDEAQVRAVHLDAFGGSSEANVVEQLRLGPAYIPELSVVAELDGAIVGHCVSSRAVFTAAPIIVLGPIGVLRRHQRCGVGTALMLETIRVANKLGFAGIVLIGHPSYYPRFGFVPASRFGLHVAYDVPDDVAMVLPIRPDALAACAGLVEYPAAFALSSE